MSVPRIHRLPGKLLKELKPAPKKKSKKRDVVLELRALSEQASYYTIPMRRDLETGGPCIGEMIVLTFPGLPPNMNGPRGLLRLHWATRNELGAEWERLVATARGDSKVKFGICRAEIRVWTTSRRDWVNLLGGYKLIEDAIVRCGIIPDDGPEYVLGIELQQTKVKHKKDVRTEIILVSLDEVMTGHEALRMGLAA